MGSVPLSWSPGPHRGNPTYLILARLLGLSSVLPRIAAQPGSTTARLILFGQGGSWETGDSPNAPNILSLFWFNAV